MKKRLLFLITILIFVLTSCSKEDKKQAMNDYIFENFQKPEKVTAEFIPKGESYVIVDTLKVTYSEGVIISEPEKIENYVMSVYKDTYEIVKNSLYKLELYSVD